MVSLAVWRRMQPIIYLHVFVYPIIGLHGLYLGCVLSDMQQVRVINQLNGISFASICCYQFESIGLWAVVSISMNLFFSYFAVHLLVCIYLLVSARLYLFFCIYSFVSICLYLFVRICSFVSSILHLAVCTYCRFVASNILLSFGVCYIFLLVAYFSLLYLFVCVCQPVSYCLYLLAACFAGNTLFAHRPVSFCCTGLANLLCISTRSCMPVVKIFV